MPSFDSARERFRLGADHLKVLGHLHDGEAIPEDLVPARDAMREAGLLSEEDAVLPELATLTRVLADTILLVQIEVSGGDGVTLHGAVVGQDACYTYETWPGEQEAEYVPTDLSMLVWSLARAVGLRNRDIKPPQAPIVNTTVGVLDAGFTAIAQMNAESVEEAAERLRAALSEAGAPGDPELTVLTHLILQLNANWRMTVAFQNRSGKQTEIRGIAVLDCGPLGYWLRERPAEPIMPNGVSPSAELRLVHVEAKDLWDMITNLIPDRDELNIVA